LLEKPTGLRNQRILLFREKFGTNSEARSYIG
jgi:hypothetical protein